MVVFQWDKSVLQKVGFGLEILWVPRSDGFTECIVRDEKTGVRLNGPEVGPPVERQLSLFGDEAVR